MKFSHNKLKKIIFSDVKGKFFAVVIAVFLWYYVNVISIEKVYISLPITLENQPINKKLDVKDDLVVRVEISAHDDVSRRIKDLSASIDLSDYKLGSSEYPISLRNLPHDIHVKMIPTHKNISIYSVVTNTVPVRVRVQPNSLLTNISYTPSNVQIVGIPKNVNRIERVDSVNLNYPILMQNTLKTNINLIHSKSFDILNNKGVSVILNFNQKFYTNEVFLSLDVKNLDKKLNVENTNMVVLTLITTTNDIEKLLLRTKVTVDLTNISTAGLYTLPLHIESPTNVFVLDGPTNVSVNLTKVITGITNSSYDLFGDTLEASLEGLTIDIEETNKSSNIQEELDEIINLSNEVSAGD